MLEDFGASWKKLPLAKDKKVSIKKDKNNIQLKPMKYIYIL